jgi:hypothetical protein
MILFRLIRELIQMVYEFLTDYDFCNYLSCSKSANQHSKLKILTSQFDLIKHYNKTHKYILTNILLTDNVINTNLEIILPLTTTNLYINMFDGIIINSSKLKNLRFIDFGIHYTNNDIIDNLKFMKKEMHLSLAIDILVNNIIAHKLRKDLKSIREKRINRDFTGTLNLLAICSIYKNAISKLLDKPNNQNFNKLVCLFSNFDIDYIIAQHDILKNFFSAYKSPFEMLTKNDLINFCGILEFIFDKLKYKIILLQNIICVTFNCSNITQYIEFWKRQCNK